MATSAQNLASLFRACLEIVNPNEEGPQFALQLLVHPVSHTVSGTGLYTASPLEPIEITLNIRGQYFENGDSIVVSCYGYDNGTQFLVCQLKLNSWKDGEGMFRELNGQPNYGAVVKAVC